MKGWKKITIENKNIGDPRIQSFKTIQRSIKTLLSALETLGVFIWLVSSIVSTVTQLKNSFPFNDGAIIAVSIISLILQFAVIVTCCILLNKILDLIFHIIDTNEISKRQIYLKNLNIIEDKYDEECLRYDGWD